MTGIIVPRDGGLAIALTEKLEDMVAIIFLPLVRQFYHPAPPMLTTYTSISRYPGYPLISAYWTMVSLPAYFTA